MREGFTFFRLPVVQRELCHDPGTKLLNQNVIVRNQLVYDLCGPAVLQIEGHAAFAPSEVGKGSGHFRTGNKGRYVGNYIRP